MPNDNLGTAHGRIRISVDDKQVGLLERNLVALNATMNKMSRSMTSMQNSLSRMERDLRTVSSQVERSIKVNREYIKSVSDIGDEFDGAGHTTQNWTRDLRVLTQQIRTAQKAAERLIPPIQTLSRIGNVFTAYRDNNKGLLGTFRGLSAAGQAAGGLALLRNQLLGVNKAMQDLPRWQQQVVNTVGKLQLLSFVAGGTFAALNRTVRTFTLGKIRLDAISTAKAIELLRARSQRLGDAFADANGNARNLLRGMRQLTSGAMNAITGFAVMRAGVQGLANRFAFLTRSIRFWSKIFPGITAIIATSIASLPAALEVLSKALVKTSNFIIGLWDGVKQLSGGLLVLPGLIANIAAVASTLGATFSGLKDQFKDLFDEDPLKQWEAYLNLPDHLKPLGRFIMDMIPRLKEFQKVLQTRAFDGLVEQLTPLTDYYLPKLQSGMLEVVTAIRNSKNQFVGFLAQAQTASAIEGIYSRTAQAINALNPAIQPVLEGLRDIAVVGSTWLRDMMPSVTILLQRFSEWARVNSENGNVMHWIRDAWHGIIDLKDGTMDLISATGRLLTMFADNTGENGLARFASAMERFDKTVQNSLDQGALHRFREVVQGAGSESIDRFKDIMRSLNEPLQQIIPLVRDISTAFADKMVPAIKATAQSLAWLFDFFNETGFGKLIGHVLGTVAAFSLLKKTLGPIKNIAQILIGGLTGSAGLIKVARGLETAAVSVGSFLEKFGKAGSIAGKAVITVGSSASRLLGILSRLGIAVTVATTAWVAYSGSQKMISDGNREIGESAQHAKERVQALKEAFVADQGKIGGNVLDTLHEQITTATQDLQELGSKAPDLMDHLGQMFSGAERSGPIPILPQFFSQTKEFNKVQEAAERAQRIVNSFDAAKVSTTELQAAISGTFTTFNELKKKLTDIGGDEAAQQLQEWRDEFERIRQEMDRLGPGGAKLARGIQEIANAGGEATTKLEGLKLVLEGLGILQVDVDQAAFDYATSLRELEQKISDVATSGIDFTDVLDKTGKGYNYNSEGAQELFNILQPLGNEFLTLVSNGKNADELYQRFEERLSSLAAATNLPIEALRTLAERAGLSPGAVGLAIQVEGKDQVVQDITSLILSAQYRAQDGVGIPVHVADPSGLERELEAVVGDVFDKDGSNLIIKPDLDPQKLAEIARVLSEKGIQVPGTPLPAKPAQMPVAPTIPPAIKGQEPVQGQAPNQPGVLTPQVIEEQKTSIQQYADDIAQKFEETSNEARESGKTFIDMFAEGLKNNPEAIRAAERMAEEIMERFHRSPPKKGPLAEHGDAARYAGRMFGNVYAAGIVSATGDVTGAASTVAGAASSGLGGAGQGFYEAGKFLGQLSQIVDFAEHFTEAIGQMAQTIVGFMRFVSDPLGQGTFFGQQRRWRRDPAISDAEISRRQADAAQDRAFRFWESGRRDLSWWDATTGLPKMTTGTLKRDSSKQEIIGGMIAAGQAAGLNDKQIEAMVATAIHESGLDADIVGKGQGAFLPGGGREDAYGLFQQSSGWGTVEQRTDPNYAINKFIEAYKAQLAKTPDPLLAATLAQNPQLGGGAATSDYHALQQRFLAEAQKEIKSTIESGATVPMTSGALPFSGGIPTMAPNEKIEQSGTGKLAYRAEAVANMLLSIFPQIKNIHTIRPDSFQWHPSGRGLDIQFGAQGGKYGPTTVNKEIGDTIAAWANANKAALGINNVLWQVKDHFDHVHLDWQEAIANTPFDATGLKFPTGTPGVVDTSAFGPPIAPEDIDKMEEDLKKWLVLNPETGKWEERVPHGEDAGKPPAPINPRTGKPWTPEEANAFFSDPRAWIQYDQSVLKPGDDKIPGIFQGTQDDLLNETKTSNKLLRDAIAAIENPSTSDKEFGNALDILQAEQERQKALDTPASRALASQIGGVISGASSERGFSQEENIFDTVSQIVGSASSIASDVFAIINSTIDAIGATKNLVDLGIRYPSNTEDIFKAIDDVQKFIQLGADIAGAVSSISGAISSVIGAAGGADPSGGASGAATAIAAVSQIAGLIQSALETTNAIIDLGQEAYRIIGNFVGPMLGMLAGNGDQLMGHVRLLLDEYTGQLLAFSADNPLDKRAHNLPFTDGPPNPNGRGQLIGNLNYYAGPGQDPRDSTRQMMFQVKTSQLMVATNG